MRPHDVAHRSLGLVFPSPPARCLVGAECPWAREETRKAGMVARLDMACRKFGEADIDKKTKRWGVEAFRDDNTSAASGFYISRPVASPRAEFQGPVAAAQSEQGPRVEDRARISPHEGRRQQVRQGDQVHSMEVFRDPNVEIWLFISEQGNIAATNGKLFPAPSTRPPNGSTASICKSAKAASRNSRTPRKFGIEVYPTATRQPRLRHRERRHRHHPRNQGSPRRQRKIPGLAARPRSSCRKHDEKSFTEKTRKFGVEVYHDVTTGNLIFISETGSISVTPALRASKRRPRRPRSRCGRMA